MSQIYNSASIYCSERSQVTIKRFALFGFGTKLKKWHFDQLGMDKKRLLKDATENNGQCVSNFYKCHDILNRYKELA